MRLAVLGVGLIGGSIGLAARERLGTEVIGFDSGAQTLELALARGAVDEAAGSLAEAVAEAEVVFCAAPVNALGGLVEAALAASGEGTIVTDAGSTKRELTESVSGLPGGSRFIGGHPLAGAETAGVANSRADLFDGARWYLTPTDRSEGVLFERLRRIVAGLGARPEAIDPGEHDRAMATISHLPHVLSNVLVSRASQTLARGDRQPEVGRSFRDGTRVAGANPSIWADIYGTNADAIAEEIDAVVERLQEAAGLLRAGDRERLDTWQRRAGEERRALIDERMSGGPVYELRVAVENRPGTVAEIALALGRHGVNIEDMSLFPSTDRRTGAISLWVRGEPEAARAREVVSGLGHQVSPPAGEG